MNVVRQSACLVVTQITINNFAFLSNRRLVVHRLNNKSRKKKPQKLTQLSSRSHPRHLVGKKTAQKRHHHRHHKREPGEQQFPIQVVTG